MGFRISFGLLEFILLTDMVKLERRNVAVNKTITSSTINPLTDWQDLTNIVDGNLTRDGEACACCASTAYWHYPWITVDLEREYWIDVVTLYGRTDIDVSHGYQSFLGIKMYFTQATKINENTTVAYKVEGSGFINFVNISFEEQIQTRYITFYIPEEGRIIIFCEVEIYGTDCMYGFYGPMCDQTCVQCYNDEPCDDITGDCRNCPAGYMGPKCDIECRPGRYGKNCQFPCGHCYGDLPCDYKTGACENCKAGYRGTECVVVCKSGTFGDECKSKCGQCHDDKPCDPITGDCEKCKAGYNGNRCFSECDDRLYGSNCPGICGYCFNGEPCDKVDGTCEFCSPGYQGRLCDTECKPGSYGQNCSEICGICQQYTSCNHVTGICVNGCATGRRGSLCNQDCETNTFGENCSQTCHCQDGISCNPLTGSCDNGACADGYSGEGCQQVSFERQQEENGISVPIFMGVVAGLICIIGGLVAIFLVSKYRNNQREAQPGKSRRTQSHNYDDLQL